VLENNIIKNALKVTTRAKHTTTSRTSAGNVLAEGGDLGGRECGSMNIQGKSGQFRLATGVGRCSNVTVQFKYITSSNLVK